MRKNNRHDSCNHNISQFNQQMYALQMFSFPFHSEILFIRRDCMKTVYTYNREKYIDALNLFRVYCIPRQYCRLFDPICQIVLWVGQEALILFLYRFQSSRSTSAPVSIECRWHLSVVRLDGGQYNPLSVQT